MYSKVAGFLLVNCFIASCIATCEDCYSNYPEENYDRGCDRCCDCESNCDGQFEDTCAPEAECNACDRGSSYQPYPDDRYAYPPGCNAPVPVEECSAGEYIEEAAPNYGREPYRYGNVPTELRTSAVSSIYPSRPVLTTIPEMRRPITENIPSPYRRDVPYNYALGPAYGQPIAVGEPYPSPANFPCEIERGPQVRPNPFPVRNLPRYSLPPTTEPFYGLRNPLVPPRTVLPNRCPYSEVVERPQLYQRIIQEQRNQRYLKKTIVPRLEKVTYYTKPRY